MKVGVIGLGSIGSRHAKNLTHLGHEVIGYDPSQTVAWPEVPHALLEDALKADAVVIASPTPTHYDYIWKAFNPDNPKHIFVEKPIADKNLDQIPLVTMVGYNLRFHSCVIKAKEWIDAGALGDVGWANFVVAQFSTKPDYLRDGVILNWSHEIDLALYLLGPAIVRACVTDGDHIDAKETLADIILFHPYFHDSHTTIHLDYWTKPEIRQSIIVGSRATIIMDLLGRHAWLRNSEGLMIDSFVGDDTWDSNYLDEMETFIARVEGKETIGCTGLEGLEVLKICLKAKELSQSL